MNLAIFGPLKIVENVLERKYAQSTLKTRMLAEFGNLIILRDDEGSLINSKKVRFFEKNISYETSTGVGNLFKVKSQI